MANRVYAYKGKERNIIMAGNFDKCPECNSENMLKMGGCDTCQDCFWSACPVA